MIQREIDFINVNACGVFEDGSRWMEEIVTILSTREWAIAIWGTGFFVWMLTQREIRKSLWNVIKILLGKNLRHFFLIIALYVAGITMIFYQLPFWNNIYLKDIIL